MSNPTSRLSVQGPSIVQVCLWMMYSQSWLAGGELQRWRTFATCVPGFWSEIGKNKDGKRWFEGRLYEDGNRRRSSRSATPPSELKPEPCHGKYPLLIAAELDAGLRGCSSGSMATTPWNCAATRSSGKNCNTCTNPVKAGIVTEPHHYLHSSAHPDRRLDVLEIV